LPTCTVRVLLLARVLLSDMDGCNGTTVYRVGMPLRWNGPPWPCPARGSADPWRCLAVDKGPTHSSS
jgi:hypothetical protein